MARESIHHDSGKKVLARGAIGVDPRAAIAKLREFMLPDPALYVAELVRAVSELEATNVYVENSASDFVLTAETAKAPPSAEQLSHLFEHLFSNQSRVLRLLAIATNTALGLGPKFVDLYTTTANADAGAPEGQGVVQRVRFLPQNDAEEPELDGKIEAVAPAEKLPRQALRIHVRERFGTSVMREWFGSPVESKILRERCTRVKAPILWAKTEELVVSAQPSNAILTQPLSAKLQGELWLVDSKHPQRGMVQFFEKGVLLSNEKLNPEMADLPLAVWIDEAALPTNVSRSAVDRTAPVGRTMLRAIDDAIEALFEQAVVAVEKGNQDLVPILRSYFESRYESRWLEAMRDLEFTGNMKHMDRIARVPLIPMVNGTLRSLADLANCPPGVVLEHRGSDLRKKELFPWLADVVAAGSDDIIHTLLLPMDCGDAEVALAQAEESFRRYQRFYQHQPRSPRVNTRSESILLRAALNELPQANRPEAPDALDGEIVVSLSPRGAQPVKVTVFVDGRPLPTEDVGVLPFQVEIALQAPTLRARNDFTGPLHDSAFDTAMKYALSVYREMVKMCLRAVVTPDAISGDEPRAKWLQQTALSTTGVVRARLVRYLLSSLLENMAATTARSTLLALIKATPALYSVPMFEATNGVLYSFQQVEDQVKENGGVVLFRKLNAKHTHPRTPVFLLGDRETNLFDWYLPTAKRVDYTRFENRGTESLWSGPIVNDGTGPKFDWTNGEGVSGALRIASRSGTVSVLHQGTELLSVTHSGTLGPCFVRIDDGLAIPSHTTLKQLLSPEAHKWFEEAEFDFLHCLVNALYGDGPSLVRLGLSSGWVPTEPVMTYLCLAVARLRAMPKESKRGREFPSKIETLLSRLDRAPFLYVRTTTDVVRRSLHELRALAKTKALCTLSRVANDIDYDSDFEPIIVGKGELEVALGLALETRLTAADAQLTQRRETRTVRLANASFMQKPKIEFSSLGWDVSDFRATVKLEQIEAIAGVGREPGPTWIQVMHEDRTVCEYALTGNSFADGSVTVRVRFTEPQKHLRRTLDGLLESGHSLVLVAVARVLKRLVISVSKAADGTHDLGDAVRSFVQCYAQESSRIDEELKARLGRAALWRAVPGTIATTEQFTTHGKGRALVVRRAFSSWIAAEAGEAEPCAALLDESLNADQRRTLVKAIENISGLSNRDATDEFDRLQRERHLLRRAATTVSLEDAGAPAPFRVRIESLDPKLGVGEIALGNDGFKRIEWRLFSQGILKRTLVQPGPFSVLVAIESSFLNDAKIDSGVVANEIQKRVNDVLRTMIRNAMQKAARLPEWSLDAQQWALLTGPVPTPTLLSRAIFLDSTHVAHALPDLDEQQRLFGNVAFTTDAPKEPMPTIVEKRVVLLLGERQSGWISAPRVGMNYTNALREEQQALARRKLAPAEKIVVRESPPISTVIFPLELKTHDFEGEVALLPAIEAPGARVFLWHRRKPLGEIKAPAPWPAWLALEATELTPNRAETEPVGDAALNSLRNKAAELVRVALEAQFQAPPNVMASIRVDRGGSPAIGGGRALAAGMLWLLADPLTPGRIDYRAPGEGTLRGFDCSNATENKRPGSLPVGGVLWLSHDCPASGAPLKDFLAKVAQWAYRQMLGQIVGKTVVMDDKKLAHLMFASASAALDSNTLSRWAADNNVGETCTTFKQAQEMFALGMRFTIERDNPARAVQERGVIVPVEAPFYRVLQALDLVREEQRVSLSPVNFASAPTTKEREAHISQMPSANLSALGPKPSATSPQTPPRAEATKKSSEPTQADNILRALRVAGIQPRTVDTVLINSKDYSSEMASLGKDLRLVVFERHPITAALLTSVDQKSAQLALTIALIGVINRALTSFTDEDELVVQRELLAVLGASV